MSFIDKFRQKTAGLSKEEIAQEVMDKVRSRFMRRYRRLKSSLIDTNITDEQLLKALSLPPQTDLLKYFKERRQPKIFAGLDKLTSTCNLYNDYFPNSLETTIQYANEICEHHFRFLGQEHQYQAEAIDWSYDTTTKYQWPQKHYSEIDISQAPSGNDVKIPWELARLQHFITLGQAYHLTKDERFAIEFSKQLQSFVKSNPPELGIHWLCAMEVALRAISVSIAFYLFRSSPNFDLATLKALLKLMLSHGQFVRENLEFSHRITSNHYLSDLVGLLFIGVLFPEFREANHWAEFAQGEILREMDKQIYADGVDWEASTGYHALVLELFLYSFLLCKENGRTLEKRYWQKLEQMFTFVRSYLKPDGMAPLIGDCDNGRMIIWQHRAARDHSYLPSIAAILFDQEVNKISGLPSEEALWIFGATGWDNFENLAMSDPAQSAAFTNSQIYIQREGDLYTIIDCGEVGIQGRGSHGHNDMFSFELFYRERTFFVDPGSYSYTGDKSARNLFRSTAYHNTVMVDDIEINNINPAQLFVLANQAHAKINKWETSEEYDLLDAEHDGYLRLAERVIHQRQCYFNKLAGYWVITDHFTGMGQHKFSFFFNFDLGLNVELASPGRVLISDNELGLALALVPLEESEGMKAEIVPRFISRGYGERAKSWGVVYNLSASVPLTRRFLIAPCSEDDFSGVDQLVEELF